MSIVLLHRVATDHMCVLPQTRIKSGPVATRCIKMTELEGRMKGR